MAYLSTETTAAIRKALKETYPFLKFSVRNTRYSQVSVTITSGGIDFSSLLESRHYVQLNPYGDNTGDFAVLFNGIAITIKRAGNWYDNSDPMTDYHDTAFFISLNLGSHDREYEFNPKLMSLVPKAYVMAESEANADEAPQGRIVAAEVGSMTHALSIATAVYSDDIDGRILGYNSVTDTLYVQPDGSPMTHVDNASKTFGFRHLMVPAMLEQVGS